MFKVSLQTINNWHVDNLERGYCNGKIRLAKIAYGSTRIELKSGNFLEITLTKSRSCSAVPSSIHPLEMGDAVIVTAENEIVRYVNPLEIQIVK